MIIAHSVQSFMSQSLLSEKKSHTHTTGKTTADQSFFSKSSCRIRMQIFLQSLIKHQRYKHQAWIIRTQVLYVQNSRGSSIVTVKILSGHKQSAHFSLSHFSYFLSILSLIFMRSLSFSLRSFFFCKSATTAASRRIALRRRSNHHIRVTPRLWSKWT